MNPDYPRRWGIECDGYGYHAYSTKEEACQAIQVMMKDDPWGKDISIYLEDGGGYPSLMTGSNLGCGKTLSSLPFALASQPHPPLEEYDWDLDDEELPVSMISEPGL
jgi:hypothetical protein